ncbi:MAG: DUF6318 family protein [Kineosporiaceae bacterium]
MGAALVGCSGSAGDERPAASTGASPSGPPATSGGSGAAPSSTLRPLPPEATELSEAGAVAFLEWWVEMYNHVEATGETELVFEHSEPGCTFCQNFVERVDPVYAAGGRIEREAPTRFLDIQPEGISPQNALIVKAGISSGASLTYGSAGELIRSAPADDPPLDVVVGLQWAENRWLVIDVGPEEVT